MAYEKALFDHTFQAAGDLSTKQFYAMKLDSAGKVTTCTGTTDKVIGILQNKPDADGKEAVIRMAGISKVNSDAALAIADAIGTSADGQLATYAQGTDTTKYNVGVVLVASAAAGGLAVAAINCLSQLRLS